MHLIDYIKDVIDVDGENTNFQKASCTLDASVKIYGYRVDDTLYSSFRVLENLNRNETTTDEVTKKVVEEGKSQKLNVNDTIEKNKSNLNTKDFGTIFTVDPLFKDMSKLFDAGGTSGMLLNNLECYNGCMLVFDSNEDIKSLEEKIEDSIDITIDNDDISLIKKSLGNSELCQELDELRNELGTESKLRDSIMNLTPNTTFIPEDPSFYPDETIVTQVNNDIDDDDDDMDNNNNDNNIDFNPQSPIHTVIKKENDNYPSFNAIINNINEYGYIKTDIVSSHNNWKFTKKKVIKNKTDKVKEKKSQNIDFNEAISKNAFALLKPTKSKKKENLTHYLLPSNPYDPKKLLKFFLIPNLTLKPEALDSLSKGNIEVADPVTNEYQYNNELDASYIAPNVLDDDSDNEPPPDYEVKELVAPDHIIKNIDIKYAKKASNIDVRKLKSTLWNVIKEETNDNDNMSLSNTIKQIDVKNLNLKPIKPPEQDNSSITFSFICLLHVFLFIFLVG